MTDQNMTLTAQATPQPTSVAGQTEAPAQQGAATTAEDSSSPLHFLTIEAMRGQEYSVGIFFFMLAGVAVFVTIILKFALSAMKEKGLRKGEKVLFAWILLGTIGAVIFGGIQLLQGRLF